MIESHSQLVIKDQLAKLFYDWCCDEPLPTKKTSVYINFTPLDTFQLVKAEWTDQKSTYNERLYKITFYRDEKELGIDETNNQKHKYI